MSSLKVPTLIGMVSLAVMVGCTRQQSPASASPSQQAPPSATMPAVQAAPAPGAPPAPPAPPPSPVGAPEPATAAAAPATAAQPSEFATPEVERTDVNLGMLQEVVESYTRATNRKAASLQELVSAHYLTAIPPAPKGKRYLLDAVTQTVKTVNQ